MVFQVDEIRGVVIFATNCGKNSDKIAWVRIRIFRNFAASMIFFFLVARYMRIFNRSTVLIPQRKIVSVVENAHLSRILLSVFLFLSVCGSVQAQSDYYLRQAEGYMRDAEYYNRRAEGYERDAEYYNKQAEGYLRDADYYTRHQDYDKANTRIRWANDASEKARTRLKWAADEREKARTRLKWAQEAMEKAKRSS